MITPSELSINRDTDRRHDEDAIEEHFDTAIKLAHLSGQWPACPRSVRSGWSIVSIARVTARYSAAGWVVTPDPTGRSYALITPPATSPAAP